MSGVRRVYFYLVTLITLGILAWGVGTILSLLFNLAFSGSSAIGQPRFNQQQLSLGLAMLVIGGPLWFFFWSRVRKYVNGNAVEIGSALRKFFLNFILVVSSLTAISAAPNLSQMADFRPAPISKCLRQPGGLYRGLHRLVLPLAGFRGGRPAFAGSQNTAPVVCLYCGRLGTDPAHR